MLKCAFPLLSYSVCILPQNDTHILNYNYYCIFSGFDSVCDFMFKLCLCSWSGDSLTWRWTSSSRMQKASPAWWSCWSTVMSPARRRSGACSQLSYGRVFATYRPAPRWGSSSRCCRRWAPSTTWLQVSAEIKSSETLSPERRIQTCHEISKSLSDLYINI